MPLIGDRQFRAAVGDLEADAQIVAAHQRARLHQPAEPEALARRDMLLGQPSVGVEKNTMESRSA